MWSSGEIKLTDKKVSTYSEKSKSQSQIFRQKSYAEKPGFEGAV
jgi:hypothetical protein